MRTNIMETINNSNGDFAPVLNGNSSGDAVKPNSSGGDWSGTRPIATSRQRVLVVEDDPAILRQIEYNLSTDGYIVETAENGVEAIKKLMAAPPDLLITDVMMPEMDGYELVASLRSDAVLAELPVIMLTARTQESEVAQGIASGTDLYLTKPYDPAELLAFVRRILPQGE